MKRIVAVIGILLIVLGIVGLAHPSLKYHKEEEVARIGSMRATVNEQKTAQVPVAASVAVLLVGIVLVVVGTRRP